MSNLLSRAPDELIGDLFFSAQQREAAQAGYHSIMPFPDDEIYLLFGYLADDTLVEFTEIKAGKHRGEPSAWPDAVYLGVGFISHRRTIERRILEADPDAGRWVMCRWCRHLALGAAPHPPGKCGLCPCGESEARNYHTLEAPQYCAADPLSRMHEWADALRWHIPKQHKDGKEVSRLPRGHHKLNLYFHRRHRDL